MDRIREAKTILGPKQTSAIGMAALGVSTFDIRKVTADYEVVLENLPSSTMPATVQVMEDKLIDVIVLCQISEEHEDNDEFYSFLSNVFPKLISLQLGIYDQYCPMDYGLLVHENIIDPSLNSLFARANESLIELGYRLERSSDDLFEKNEMTMHSMNELLWDEVAGLYHRYNLKVQEVEKNHHASGFLPIIAGVPDINQVLEMVHRAFGDDFRQAGCYSFPSYNLNQVSAQHEISGHGAISIRDNWLLIQGLRRYDMEDLADLVQEDTLALVEQYGFYAHFNPQKSLTSNGLGKPKNQSAAGVFLDLLRADF